MAMSPQMRLVGKNQPSGTPAREEYAHDRTRLCMRYEEIVLVPFQYVIPLFLDLGPMFIE